MEATRNWRSWDEQKNKSICINTRVKIKNITHPKLCGRIPTGHGQMQTKHENAHFADLRHIFPFLRMTRVRVHLAQTGQLGRLDEVE